MLILMCKSQNMVVMSYCYLTNNNRKGMRELDFHFHFPDLSGSGEGHIAYDRQIP